MKEAVNRFYRSIEDAEHLSQTSLIELFVYFLTVEIAEMAATQRLIDSCFENCELAVPVRTSARLSEGLRTNPPRFIKVEGGYRLERRARDALSSRLGGESIAVETEATLRQLEHKIPEGPTKAFLKETIDCFEAGAGRATIVMAWILTMDHLYEHVLAHRRSVFNASLSKDADKRIRISAVSKRDDFSEMPESKFIELCRSANIISNDVRKILDQKLGTRNSSAHPSGVRVGKVKVIDFVDDLVNNVILKYPA